MKTNTGQNLDGHLVEIRQIFAYKIVIAFGRNGKIENSNRSMFVNMDDAAIYFVTKRTSTVVHPTDCNNTGMDASESNNHRIKVGIAATSSRTMLPFFVIFNGSPKETTKK